jgi:hypothetical protein
MADKQVEEIVEAYEYDKNGWTDIRKEARKDMRFVGGDPWDEDDRKQRKNRPTIAPEELSQYRNQVLNGLLQVPRGMKFSPRGSGASAKGAEFYQNKARETEYRSHATQAYILAADNALQRGYGFVRLKVDYVSPRSANQEIFIEGFPDPDMVTPDADALRPDSADMTRCTVHQWMTQTAFLKKFGSKAKIRNFGAFASGQSSWVQGSKILVGEHWTIKTTPRQLLLAEIPAPIAPGRMIAPQQGAPQSLQIFEDELADYKQRAPQLTVVRSLREVDYPHVWMYLTNGLEILHEQEWLGKYIPIVSCYGKVLYIDEGGEAKRTILSMTRFGRDPWKAFCYACSQELEVLSQVPKAALMIARGSMNANELTAVEESYHQPKAYLTYDPTLNGQAINSLVPPPQRAEYGQGEYLQMIEQVKEGFRRSIQAAMGSNFLPTQAQSINDKSGVALDNIDRAATQGTRHFVNSYEDLIRQTGVCYEDLLDKVHDYAGQTDVILPDGKSQTITINTPGAADNIDTGGDYLCTVSSAPSSDSEHEAAAEFVDTLIAKIDMIAQISGQKPAAAILAQAIRMRNVGPMGDQLADIIEPPEYKAEDGKPPDPRMLGMQQQIHQLQQQLQEAGFVIKTKQVEGKLKFQIEQMKVQATSEDKAADREAKLVVAELSAKIDRMALLLEASAKIGVRLDGEHDAHVQRLHDAHAQRQDHVHAAVEGAKDRLHDHTQNRIAHQEALDAAAHAVAIQPPEPPAPGAGV